MVDRVMFFILSLTCLLIQYCESEKLHGLNEDVKVKSISINNTLYEEKEYYCIKGCEISSNSFVFKKSLQGDVFIEMWQNNKYKYNNISNTCSVADTTATGGILKTKNKRFKSVSYERTLEELNLCLGKALCSFNIKKLRYIRMRLSGLGRITIEALNMLKLDNVKNLQYEHHNIVFALSKTSLRSDLNSIFHVYNITVDTISCQEEIFMIPQDSFLAVNYVGNKIAIPKRIMDCEVLITFKPL